MAMTVIDEFNQQVHRLEMLYRLHSRPHEDTFEQLRIVTQTAVDVGAHQKALKYAKDCVQMSEDLYDVNSHEVGVSYADLGNLLTLHGKYDLAYNNLENALEVLENVFGKDTAHEDIADVYNLMGKVFCQQCTFDKAIECHNKALEVLYTIFDTEEEGDIAMTYRHIGDVHYACSKYERAVVNYQRSVDLFDAVLLSLVDLTANFLMEMMRARYKLAKTKSAQGCHVEALAICNKAREYLKHYVGDEQNIYYVEFYDCKSVIARELDDYKRSFETSNQASTLRLAFYNSTTMPMFQPIAINLIEIGRMAVKMHRHNRATHLFDNALAILESVYDSHHPEIGRLYNHYADAYIFRGDFSKALAYCSKALAVQRVCYGVACDHVDLITTHCQFGEIYIHLQDYENSHKSNFTSLEMCKRLFSDHFDTELTSRNYINFGMTYLGQGENRQALLYFEKALTALNNVYPPQCGYKNINNVYNMMGLAYRNLNQYIKAEEYHQLVLNNSRLIYHKQHLESARALVHLGDLAFQNEEYSKALSHYEMAERCCQWEESLGKYTLLKHAQVLTLISRVYYIQFDFRGLKIYLNKAEELLGMLYGARLMHPLGGVIALYFGDYYKAIGNYKSALQSYESALETTKEIYKLNCDRYDIAEIYYNIGDTLAYFQKYYDSFSHYKKAFTIWSKLYKGMTSLTIAKGLEGLGSAHANLKEYKSALECFENSLLIKKKIYQPDYLHRDVVSCYHLIGNLHCSQKNFSKALDVHKEGLKLSRKICIPEYSRWRVGLSIDEIGKTLVAQGQYRQALDELQTALTLKRAYFTIQENIENDKFDFDTPQSRQKSQSLKLRYFPSIGETIFYMGKARHEYGRSKFILSEDSSERKNMFDDALRCYELALDYNLEVYEDGYVIGVADIYNNMGEVQNHPLVALHQDAMANHQKALSIRQRLFSQVNASHPEIAKSYLNIGITYSFQSSYENAKKHLDIALKLLRKHFGTDDCIPEIADVYEAQGIVELKKENLEEALNLFLACLKIRETQYATEKVFYSGFVNIHELLAKTYEKLGKTQEAKRCESLALSIANRSIKQSSHCMMM